MNQEMLKELFTEQIRDLFDAEKQLVKALPKLVEAAESEPLSEALRAHLEETKGQVTRLEQVFELLETPAKGKACKGMKGLLEEGNEAVEEEEGPMRDLAIIAGAQRVEHYEISAYGTARTLAECLGLDEAADLLQQSEDEETEADARLTSIAMELYTTAESEAASDLPSRRGVASQKGKKAARAASR
jgi:ferritin-like metal-binding protein YciE